MDNTKVIEDIPVTSVWNEWRNGVFDKLGKMSFRLERYIDNSASLDQRIRKPTKNREIP